MLTVELAATQILGWTDKTDPAAPGQFAIADANRVENILRAAGWDATDISKMDVPCSLSSASRPIVRRMGKVGMVLPDLEEGLRATVEAALDEAFAAFVRGERAYFDCACWMVRARRFPD